VKVTLRWAAAAALFFFQWTAVAQTGALENPAPNGIESGIGVISGWHCTGRVIEFSIDGVNLGRAGSGTSRNDTQGVCGRSDTGFSLLFNFSLLAQGTHQIEALADGVVFATASFSVGTLGSEFLTNLSRPITVPDFPEVGTSANLRWAQSKQNFVIESSAPTNSLPLAGNYVLSQFSVVFEDGTIFTSSTPGTSFAGTMAVRSDGTVTQTLDITIGSVNISVTGDSNFVDYGYYVDVSSGIDSASISLLSRGNVLTTHSLFPPPDGFTQVDVWTRTTTATSAAFPAVPTKASASRGHSGTALPGRLLGTAVAEILRR
jgi:hypothetical protein